MVRKLQSLLDSYRYEICEITERSKSKLTVSFQQAFSVLLNHINYFFSLKQDFLCQLLFFENFEDSGLKSQEQKDKLWNAHLQDIKLTQDQYLRTMQLMMSLRFQFESEDSYIKVIQLMNIGNQIENVSDAQGSSPKHQIN